MRSAFIIATIAASALAAPLPGPEPWTRKVDNRAIEDVLEARFTKSGQRSVEAIEAVEARITRTANSKREPEAEPITRTANSKREPEAEPITRTANSKRSEGSWLQQRCLDQRAPGELNAAVTTPTLLITGSGQIMPQTQFLPTRHQTGSRFFSSHMIRCLCVHARIS
ncbi:hypothetical protein BU23DRAFT_187217 [Bimuria novae-zelandiae CBS 107.79]|uniref:Uncharacterized protein n=1 Tax=Bimuria novae-zelandiae CBS 107.79 TaxID=1447943 RepID=A0A6A5VPA6_9PLEO|nr:hypothetical protein BU23DRAFT_187217 [Bimuria novae-zelandiae CBS 107.79]